jgi:hypothetical protein
MPTKIGNFGKSYPSLRRQVTWTVSALESNVDLYADDYRGRFVCMCLSIIISLANLDEEPTNSRSRQHFFFSKLHGYMSDTWTMFATR